MRDAMEAGGSEWRKPDISGRGKSKKASKSGTGMCKPRTDSKTHPRRKPRVPSSSYDGESSSNQPLRPEAGQPEDGGSGKAGRRKPEGDIWKAISGRRGIRGNSENGSEGWRRKSGTERCLVRVTCEFTSSRRQRRESLAFWCLGRIRKTQRKGREEKRQVSPGHPLRIFPSFFALLALSLKGVRARRGLWWFRDGGSDGGWCRLRGPRRGGGGCCSWS
jgi:hypothetical protein